MAETRKYQPSTNAVGDAIRAAMGEGVRPVQPGEPQTPSGEQSAERNVPAGSVTTVRTFTFGATKKPE